MLGAYGRSGQANRSRATPQVCLLRGVLIGLGVLAALSAGLFAVAGEAEATHYRYGTISWEPTDNENEVLFTGDSAWRWSYPSYNQPELGEILPISDVDGSVDPIRTGDGATIPFQVKVVSINEDKDWFYGILVSDDGTEGIPYEYDDLNDDGDPWQAEWTGCCRISDRHSGNYHVNNPDQSFRLETPVDLEGSHSSPQTSLPPISQCPIDTLCTIQVPAVHPDGDEITFRKATVSEAGDASYVPPGPPDAPNEATIGDTNGTLHWDTTGAEHDPDFASWDTLYSMQVMLEDGTTKTPLDFFIEIVPEDTEFPYWTDATTVCGTTQEVLLGDTITFDIAAASDDVDRVVSLDHLGLPEGATFPLPDPANPVSSTFTWEPGLDHAGSHLVIFTAVDDLGAQAPPCPVTIDVDELPPEFQAPTPCVTGEPVRGIEGEPVSFPIKAASPLDDTEITLSVHQGPGAIVDTTPGDPVEGTWTWQDPVKGEHVVTIQATDDRGVTTTCAQTVTVQAPAGQSLVTSLWSGTSVPASLEYETQTVDQRGHGDQTRHHATVDPDNENAYAEAITENATVTLEGTTANASGSMHIAHAELFDGLVTIQGLTHTAHLEWDLETQTISDAHATFELDTLTVADQEVPVEYEGDPVTVPLPTGGFLTLFEHAFDPADDRADYVGNIVHAYAPLEYSRSEAILGSIVLGAGGEPTLETGDAFAYQNQPRAIHEPDDARTGQDVGDAPEDAEPIEPGVYDGALPPGDTVDYYAIDVAHGEKVNLALSPAPRATVTGGHVHVGDAPPPEIQAPGAATSPMESWTLRLLDPTLTERDVSSLPAAGTPERIEFNADVNGTWFVEVHRATSANPTQAYNYSLAASITPLPLLPQNDALSGDDAPPACDPSDDAIPTIGTGLWPGVVRDDDHADTYRFDATIGELVSIVLKPGETLDGANMALVLYDEDCNPLQRSNWYAGTHPYLPKGLPELTPELPSTYTGDYFIGVERENGIGNYYLSLTVLNPMPTAPENDAFTGTDAPASCASPTPAPPVAYQGRLHDGDTGDAYHVPYEAGNDAYLVVEMSAASSIDVTLTAPNGDAIEPEANLLDGTWVFDFQAPETGDYCLDIDPDVGGGNYMVVHGETPPPPGILPQPTPNAALIPTPPGVTFAPP